MVLGNGSTDLIDLLARAYLAPGDNAVIAEQAFARFRQCVNARNGGARLVPMREHTHDLEAMAAAVDARTRLVFVANPNNPTGTWNTRAQMEAFSDRLPGDVLVVLDEAYFEYAESDARLPERPRLRARRELRWWCLRTFSKVYGLAGLRVGYAMGAREVALALDTVREPFNTNLVGQAAALAALEDQGHLVRSLELNRVEKARLEQALAARGLRVLPSLANFLCVEVGDGAAVFQKLLRQGRHRSARCGPMASSRGCASRWVPPTRTTRLLEAIDAVVLPARS